MPPRKNILKAALILFLFGALLGLLMVLPSDAQDLPERPLVPVRAEKAAGKTWKILSIGSYTAAMMDMRLTMHEKQVGGANFVEYNPIAKPFVSLPKPAYYATGFAAITGINYLSLRMKNSPRWYRHIWWVPQAAAIAANTYGYARTKAMQNR